MVKQTAGRDKLSDFAPKFVDWIMMFKWECNDIKV